MSTARAFCRSHFALVVVLMEYLSGSFVAVGLFTNKMYGCFEAKIRYDVADLANCSSRYFYADFSPSPPLNQPPALPLQHNGKLRRKKKMWNY